MEVNIEEHMEAVSHIADLVENEEEYMDELKRFIPMLNQAINAILTYSQQPDNDFHINEEYVVQVLRDILYGMENQDSVFLLDVLRYGLLPIYDYTAEQLVAGDAQLE